MSASILTVGDELLAGDIENTNSTWLAAVLDDRGTTVGEMRTVPDDRNIIATAVSDLRDRYESVIVTGGLGSTPDDVTIEGVAAAFDLRVVHNEAVRQAIENTVATITEEHPEFEFDLDSACRYPERGEHIPNEEGIAPGWMIEDVYVLPGIPAEMRATFERIGGNFAGEVRTREFHSTIPESHLNPLLEEVRERFDVRVGCYPDEDRKRIKLSSPNHAALNRAAEWMATRPEIDAAV